MKGIGEDEGREWNGTVEKAIRLQRSQLHRKDP